jgi:adenosylhomocysteine nucleosidase
MEHRRCGTLATMTTRIGMLAPMDIELEPLVRRLALVAASPDDGSGVRYHGFAGDAAVIAMPTGIGMEAGRVAAKRLLDENVDHVMVVGIAGAIALDMPIGAVLAPAAVIERSSGARFVPTTLDDRPRHGAISCGDDLLTDQTALDELARDGVIALDMETAAVAAVCEAAGVPWSVWRSISDRAGEGLIDADLFAMTRPDGSADPDALARKLADPLQRKILERLARDATLAVESAAAAAIAACAAITS